MKLGIYIYIMGVTTQCKSMWRCEPVTSWMVWANT